MQSSDRLLASCRSWNDFWDRTRKLSNAEKGTAFERVAQLYLEAAPEYRTELQHVWLLREVPVPSENLIHLESQREAESSHHQVR
jgi:hypothetical protein